MIKRSNRAISVKENGYTFRGSKSAIFIFFLQFQTSFVGKNLLLEEQILSLKSNPCLEGLCHPRKHKGS